MILLSIVYIHIRGGDIERFDVQDIRFVNNRDGGWSTTIICMVFQFF